MSEQTPTNDRSPSADGLERAHVQPDALKLEEIRSALVAAAGGLDLEVVCLPDLPGASVGADDLEAYVYPASEGFRVGVWRGYEEQPLWSEQVAALDVAADMAVKAVTRTGSDEGRRER